MDLTEDGDARADSPSASDGVAGLLGGFVWLGLALLPVLIAIALTPGFTTQDGPAHIYSARIMNAAVRGDSPFAATFRVAWDPLPNWLGHLATMAALAIGSPEVANRVVTAATLVAFAAAILTLHWVVVGRRGMLGAAVLAALLALNVAWLLGFTSFLLGATLHPLTLAVWWSGRNRIGGRRALGLATLLVLGYFAHPISLGLTLVGMAMLAILVPGSGRIKRLAWTAVSGLPLVPLGAIYGSLTRSGGGLEPTWAHWSPTLAGVISQVGWVDPLSLAAKTTTPFEVRIAPVPAALLAPAVWSLVGSLILVGATWRVRRDDRLAWLVLAGGMVGVGLVAPDTIGVKHGHYLPQRVVLLGLVALVPWLDLGSNRMLGRLGVGALVVALLIQSAFVWDYARTCQERVGPFLQVTQHFDRGTRAGTLLNGIKGRFRANPVLHADGLIAAATDSIFWTNYETAQYYFPVKVRPGFAYPPATAFEQVAILDGPANAERRRALWRDLLRDHAAQVDRIVEWQSDPALDAITGLDYDLTLDAGSIRIWSRSPRP